MMIPDCIRNQLVVQEDMEVVGDCRGPMKILQETGRAKADAVILALKGVEEPSLCGQLLAIYPDLTIIGITEDASLAFSLQLCSKRQELTNKLNRDVINAIRTAVQEHEW
jgi:hypothetical protein